MVKNAMSGERGSRPNDAISGRWLLATVYQGGVTPEAVADTDWLHAALGVGKDTIASDVESLRKKRGLKDLAGKTIDGVRVFRPSGEESLGGTNAVWVAFGTRPTYPVAQQLETAAREVSEVGEPQTRRRRVDAEAEAAASTPASSFQTPAKGGSSYRLPRRPLGQPPAHAIDTLRSRSPSLPRLFTQL